MRFTQSSDSTGLHPSPCGSGSRTERPRRSIFGPCWRERYSALFLSPRSSIKSGWTPSRKHSSGLTALTSIQPLFTTGRKKAPASRRSLEAGRTSSGNPPLHAPDDAGLVASDFEGGAAVGVAFAFERGGGQL